MEATLNTVTINISDRVENSDGEPGLVLAIAKGWITVELDDGNTKKYRAKDLEVIESASEGEEEADDEVEGEGELEAGEAEGDEEADEVEGEGEEEPRFNGERLRQRKVNYVKQRHCGDTVATALAVTTLDAILALTRKLGLYNPAWEGLANDGQRRMNAGNRIRAWAKKAENAEAAAEELANLPVKPGDWNVLRDGRPVRRFKGDNAKTSAEEFAAEQTGKEGNTARWTVRPAT